MIGGMLAAVKVALRNRGERRICARPSLLPRSVEGREAKPQGAMAKKPSELDVMKEVDVVTISQRLSKPSLANGWTLVGDLGITTAVAPLLSIVFLRALEPDWYRQLPDSDVGFIFPEYFHGVLYGLCWLLGGLALGAFETKAVNPKNLLETIQRTAWAAVATVWLACSAWLLLRTNGWLPDSYAALGYVTSAGILPTFRDFFIDLQFEVWCLIAWRLTRAVSVEGSGLDAAGEEDEADMEELDELEESAPVSRRLLLGDMVVSGIIVPALIIVALAQTGVYTPQWTLLWDTTDTGSSKAILAHGAVLTTCWLIAALATGAYGIDSVRRTDLAKFLKSIWKTTAATAFLLALCAVLPLLLSGSSGSNMTDFDAARRFQKTFFDLLCDVELSAVCLTTWRLYYAGYI